GEVTAGPPPRGLPKVVLTEESDGSVWAVGTTRSGESIEHGLCRQFGEERPDLASRLGCPGVRDGAEAPAAPGGTARTVAPGPVAPGPSRTRTGTGASDTTGSPS
ncbi:(2Fe-2S)-binding protein, partial [Streptomyces sp. DT225]